MIYNKPRDIKLRSLPSIGSLFSIKETQHSDEPSLGKSKSDNLITAKDTASVTHTDTVTINAPQKDIDIILTERYIPEGGGDGNVFDLTKMPLLDGIPILTLPGEELLVAPPQRESAQIIPFKDEEPVADATVTEYIDESDNTIDVSEIAVDSEIPMLELTEPIAPNNPTSPPFKEESRKVKKERRELSQTVVKHGRRFKIASFFIIFYLGAIVAFILPLRPTYSESEMRYLAKFPEFSIDALISGSYFDDISTWFSDTFPYRELLTEANTVIKSYYGIETITVHGDVDIGDEIPDSPLIVPDDPIIDYGDSTDKPDIQTPEYTPPVEESPEDKAEIEVQQLGAIVVAGDSAYEYYGYSEDCAIGFVSCVNKFNALANPTGNVYAMIIPTSMDITLDDDIRKQITSTADQKAAIDLFNKSFKNCIAVDGIYNAERQHRNEYTYFRTDHHWTALGAYYAYEQFAKEKGITPISLATYPVKSFNGFLGTFYSSSGQNPALKENPDTVTAYMPFNNIDCTIMNKTGGSTMSWPVINDVTDYGSSLKYLTFIGGDNALTTITNHDNPDGGVCVVIKDSYGNAFVPFLIPHYSTVYVIDPRYYTGSLSSFCADKEIEDLIFLVNISCTRNYIYLEGLQNITR
jgi:hypothetical protein